MHIFFKDSQKILDWIFKPIFILIVLFFNIKFKKENNVVKKKLKKILIVKLLGGGSLASMLPFFLEIKKKYPKLEINLITTNKISIFAKTLKVFDNITIINLNFFFFYDLIKSFFVNYKNDLIFCFEIHSVLVGYFCSCFKGKKIIPIYTKRGFLPKIIKINFISFHKNSPYPQIYKTCFENAFGSRLFKNLNSKYFFGLSNNWIRKYYSEKNKKNFIVLAPYSSSLSRERNLEFQQIIKIFKKFKLKKWKIILIGGNEKNIILESKKLEKKLKYESYDVKNMVGLNSLEKNVKLALNAKYNIVVDSGFNHIIRLSDSKILSFWGPTNPYMQCLKLENNEKFFYKEVKCSPCVHFSDKPECGGYPNNICMDFF